MKIGEALKEFRTKRDIAISDLVAMLPISFQDYIDIESGAIEPEKPVIEQICKAMEVPTAFILFNALEERDVAPHKREAFRELSPIFSKVVAEFYTLP